MSKTEKSSYGRIVKTSSLLGGSSLVGILLRVIRTKVLATELGPAMFGVLTLYNGFIGMVDSVSSLGVGQSAVRDIVKASSSKDQLRISRVNTILHRVVWGTGLLGLIATVCLAYPASWIMFKNSEHLWSIAILGLIVLLSQLQAGQLALLSGLRLIGKVAKANVLGSFLGTLMAIPLLLWLGEKGIVAFLLAIATGQLAASWWYARSIKLPTVKVSWRDCATESSGMIKLGVVLMVSGVALAVSSYVIRVIIQAYLGEALVGIYQSAFTISGLYIGFILQAMSGDFYPHLTAISDDKKARNELVNEQMEVAILLSVPGLIALLLCSDLLISLMFSERFSGGEEVLRWLILGMLGRIISWPMGFILLAREDKVSLIGSELFISALHILLVWICVQEFGVNGAGLAFAMQYLVHIFLILWLTKTRHEYKMRRETLYLVVCGIVFVLFAFSSTFYADKVLRYSTGSVALLFAIYWSILNFVRLLGKEVILGKWNDVSKKIGFKK